MKENHCECGRVIHPKAIRCRPCALARVRGTEPYTAPCELFVADSYWPMVKTCDRCGFEH